jgi:hypothetical protein
MTVSRVGMSDYLATALTNEFDEWFNKNIPADTVARKELEAICYEAFMRGAEHIGCYCNDFNEPCGFCGS